LRRALTDVEKPDAEQTLYEHGTPNLFGNDVNAAASVPEAEIETIEVKLRPASPQRKRGLDRRSPSGLEGGAKIDLAHRLRLDTSYVMNRGTLFHAWFEEIEWLDDGVPDEQRLRAIAAQYVSAEYDLEADMAAFSEMVTRDAIIQTLSRKGYDDPKSIGFEDKVCAEVAAADLQFQVEREREFAIRDGDTVLKGAIDRLVVLCDGDRPVAADVIDFKTDRIDNNLAEKVEFYRPQLEAYRRTAARLTGLDECQIAARLLFVGAGIVEVIATD
jgi:hypothetical protein